MPETPISDKTRTPILLTTMGNTWQIPPELYCFTNPSDLDLFANHPGKDAFAKMRQDYGIEPIRELWVITTGGRITDTAIQKLLAWHAGLSKPHRPVLRIWRVKAIDDISTEAECNLMKEAIFRVALHASNASGDESPLFSLTGGRKTMSSDLQEAAGWFGCRALMHVIDNGTHLRAMQNLTPGDFLKPLPMELKDAVTPLISQGKTEKSALLDLKIESEGPIAASQWPLPMAEDGRPMDLDTIHGEFLFKALESRRQKAGYHYSQYTTGLIQGEETANFLALYSLPPKVVEKLKTTCLGTRPEKCDSELAWLKKLPKTDLHCHLGGIADCREMIEIARASKGDIERFASSLHPFLSEWQRRLDHLSPDQLRAEVIPKALRTAVAGVPEPLCVSAFLLLFEDRPELLDRILYGPWANENDFFGIGFDPYEKLGDLQGSGLLQNEANIRAACRVLLKKAAAQNITYMEVRCSPVNYTRGGLSPDRVAQIISEEFEGKTSETTLLFIASRHGKMEQVEEHVRLAQRLLDTHPPYALLRGFDLAGNEQAKPAGEMRQALMPMMERCLHFTIHAGENVPVASIWEAVYHLNAERIGHGLTLKENPELLKRFRDRGIALEMCPSSNVQIVGFRDHFLPDTATSPVYPLKEYLDAGLRVTVNTDNPGISRTDITRELHRAARLTPGGLSQWEICRIIRNGFKAAFAERSVRQHLIRDAESRLMDVIQNDRSM